MSQHRVRHEELSHWSSLAPAGTTSVRCRMQFGGEPADFKPMHAVGAGACEIRIREESGAYRAIYVAKFETAVYVLHAFQKKTRQTAKTDIDLAKARYRMIGDKL